LIEQDLRSMRKYYQRETKIRITW